MRRLRDEFGLSPTGRAAKTTFAILGKLRRESVRLSQIQDVAGCRVIVPDVPAQDELVRALVLAFESASVIDRRERPSYGYRAVHLVVLVDGKTVEVQVRTAAQQLWAEISERLSDRFGIEVKYGEGGEPARSFLVTASEAVDLIGAAETMLAELNAFASTSSVAAAVQIQIEEGDRALKSLRARLQQLLTFFQRVE